MTTTRRSVLKWSAAGLASALSWPLREALAADEGPALAIVVSPRSALSNLSEFELKRVYLGAHVNDPSGHKIVPFNQPPKSADRVVFDRRILSMDPDEVAKYWIDRKIRGKSGAPKAVGSVDLLQRVVNRLPGAIAYVRVEAVRSDVRVISIDGKKPGDRGYAALS